MAEPITMRAPCRYGCGDTTGYIVTKNGQDCVYCSACNRHQYNAPKTETGRAPRTVTTVHNGIKPSLRARIIERATGKCEMCGSRKNLHVGHLISVDAGIQWGMTDGEINSTENLICICDECNLGIGNEPVPLRFAVAMVMTRLAYKVRANDPT